MLNLSFAGIKNWFDVNKIYKTTNEMSSSKGIMQRCLILAALAVLSLFCKWFCLPLLLVAAVFIAFENGANKLSYVIFLLPFYNAFRLGRRDMFFLAYILAFAVALLGVQILISYIKKERKINWIALGVIGFCFAYFVLPIRPTSLSTIIIVLANIALFSVCYLKDWKFDFRLFVRVFFSGLVLASFMGLFVNHIERVRSFVGLFEAGLKGVYRFTGLDADPNYYSMSVTLALSCYALLYYKNAVSIKEFLFSFFVLSVFGFMTVSKTFIIVYVILLVLLLVLMSIKHRTSIKNLARRLSCLVLVVLLSIIASLSYVNFTLSRINWQIKGLKKLDTIVFDVGDALSYLYLLPYGDEINIEDYRPSKDAEYETQLELPNATILTTGRSDIWKAYLESSTSSAKSLLFGVRADGGHQKVGSFGPMACHNTIIQIVYYYGVVGLGLIGALSLLLLWKTFKKKKLSFVNLIPVFLFCIDLMALDNLTSLRTPIFVFLMALSIGYKCDRKEKNEKTENKISVIVPVYNAEKSIEKCVKSILNQTYQNFELILVDDGSKDASKEVCQKLAATDSRIIFVSKENGGCSSARNAGLDRASGEFVCFVDSDDYVDEDYLEIMINAAGEADLVVVGYKIVGSDLIREEWIETKSCSLAQIEKEVGMMYERNIINSACNKLYKKTLIKTRFDINYSLAEDLKFNISYLQNVKSIQMVDSIPYNYAKLNEESLTTGYSKEKFETFIDIAAFCKSSILGVCGETSINNVLIRNICGNFRKLCKIKTISKQEKLDFIAAYMEREEIKEALAKTSASGLKLKMSIYLLKKKKYKLLYFLYRII